MKIIEKIKGNYKVIVPILVILLCVIIFIFIYSDYKYKSKRNIKEIEVFQYLSQDKLEYKANVSYNHDNKIMDLVPKGLTIEYNSIPVYYSSSDRVIFPKSMDIVFPLKDIKEYQMDKYGVYYKEDNMHYLGDTGSFKDYNYFFIYDYKDLYFFPDDVDVYIDDVYYTHLSAMSYLTTGGGYTLQYFDKEEDKVEIVDIENKVVVVKNENYEVNVSFDYLIVYNREVMLSSSDSKLKSINELN